MRIDPDHCDDPVLLSAEVRRLRNAMSHDHWDAICAEGDRVSREEGYKAMQAEVAALHAECERLRLTEAEREAIEVAAEAYADDHGERFAATLRGLLERFSPIAKCESDSPQPIATPNPPSTPAECTVPPEWTSKPYWVDPPSGWRYGFPRLYDPAKDGDMRAWMIASGYPEHLANQGLACTFTSQTEGVG